MKRETIKHEIKVRGQVQGRLELMNSKRGAGGLGLMNSKGEHSVRYYLASIQFHQTLYQ